MTWAFMLVLYGLGIPIDLSSDDDDDDDDDGPPPDAPNGAT